MTLLPSTLTCKVKVSVFTAPQLMRLPRYQSMCGVAGGGLGGVSPIPTDAWTRAVAYFPSSPRKREERLRLSSVGRTPRPSSVSAWRPCSRPSMFHTKRRSALPARTAGRAPGSCGNAAKACVLPPVQDVVLMRALRDMNLPKFVFEDVPLFLGLISDLFPGLDCPRVRYPDFNDAVEQVLEETGFIVLPVQVRRRPERELPSPPLLHPFCQEARFFFQFFLKHIVVRST